MFRKLSLVFLLIVLPLFAQDLAGIRGSIVDSGKIILPGVTVHLSKAGVKDEQIAYTNAEGNFEFSNLSAGRYTVTAELSGFQTVNSDIMVEASTIRNIVITMPPAQTVQESVTVTGQTEGTAKLEKDQTQRKEELGEQTIHYAPIVNQRFQDTLPLVPSVVRGPDGNININGARATESSLLVNGSNVTDPVTGNFAIELPIEAVETVQVFTNPYSPEYGKFSGGVTNVATKAGENKFKFELNDFMPRLHFVDGLQTQGVEAWTPRVRFSGPTRFKNLYFSLALQYKFTRTFLEDLPEDANFMELKAVDALTQFDYKPSERQQFTFTFSLFPEKIENVNLNTFLPAASTPDFKQHGYNVAAYHRTFLHDSSFFESSISFKSYDVSVLPKGDLSTPFILAPEGMSGSYFNFQDRDSTRFQWTETYTLRPLFFNGSHVLRTGIEYGHTSYSGVVDYAPIEIRGSSGQLFEQITTSGEARIGNTSNELTAYLQDHWSPANDLTIDWGLRMDFDTLSSKANPGPRAAFAYAPSSLPQTVFKGGLGIFYDKIFLNAVDFEKYPERVITDNTGTHRIANVLEGNIKTPRSTTWNLEADQQLNSRILLRANFLSRHSRDQFLLIPTEDEVLLNNQGKARYWQWELTAQYHLMKENNLYFSYVRSSSKGDTNDFDSYLGNFQKPIIREDAFTFLPFHTPNRFLFWGIVRMPARLYVSPLLEIRNGFPYSAVNAAQQYVGERNGLRFPVFAQLDLRLTRTFTVFGKYKVTAGMKVFNVLNRFNPRDVQNNIDSPAFGTFYNSVGRTFRSAFEIQY